MTYAHPAFDELLAMQYALLGAPLSPEGEQEPSHRDGGAEISGALNPPRPNTGD